MKLVDFIIFYKFNPRDVWKYQKVSGFLGTKSRVVLIHYGSPFLPPRVSSELSSSKY